MSRAEWIIIIIIFITAPISTYLMTKSRTQKILEKE